MATSQSEVDLKTGEIRLVREVPAIPVQKNKRTTYRPLNAMNGDHLVRLMRVDGTADVVHYNSVTEQDLARSLKVWYRGHRSVLEDLQRGQRHLYRTMCRLHKEKQRLIRQEHIRRTEEIKAKMDAIRTRGPVMAAIQKWRENMTKNRKQREEMETPQSLSRRRRSQATSRRQSLASVKSGNEGNAAAGQASLGHEEDTENGEGSLSMDKCDINNEKYGDDSSATSLTRKAIKKFAAQRRGSQAKAVTGQRKETPGARKFSLQDDSLLMPSQETPTVVRCVTIVYEEDRDDDCKKTDLASSADVTPKDTDSVGIVAQDSSPKSKPSDHTYRSRESPSAECATPDEVMAVEANDEEFLAKLTEWNIKEQNYKKAKYKKMVEHSPDLLPALREEGPRHPSAALDAPPRSRGHSRGIVKEGTGAEGLTKNVARTIEVSKDNEAVTVTRTEVQPSNIETERESPSNLTPHRPTPSPQRLRRKSMPPNIRSPASPDAKPEKDGAQGKTTMTSEDCAGKPETTLAPVKGRRASMTRPPEVYLRDNFRQNKVADVIRAEGGPSPTSTSSRTDTQSRMTSRDPKSRKQSMVRQVRDLKRRKAAHRAASLDSERVVGYLLETNGSLVQLMAEPQRKNFAPPNDREVRQRQLLVAEERSREAERKARVDDFFQNIFPHEDPEEAERRRAALAAPKEEPKEKGSTLANFLFKIFRGKPLARGVDPNSMEQVAKCQYIRVYDPTKRPDDDKMAETSWRRRHSDPHYEESLRETFPLPYSGCQ